nr:sensor histidine kinase [uncultured Flavobacterium sp.]
MIKRSQNYFLHIIGSLLFISIPALLSPDLNNVSHLFDVIPFRQSFFRYVLLLIFFYVNYFFIIPRFYFKGRYFLFVVLLIVSCAVISFLPEYIFPWNRGGMWGMPMPGGNPGGMPPHGMNMNMRPRRMMPFFISGDTWQFLLVGSLSFLLRVNQRLADMESEKLKTELSYLKAQINPHFLFNTLNSLYALTLEKSDAAPGAILKLSGMMRYVVTESSRERVALDNELDYIRNYISLQQLRMDEATNFRLEISGDTSGKVISPLVLIPFIENAFKYGLNPEKESVIYISITTRADELTLLVKNNKVNDSLQPEEVSGRGVENTRLRLEYLYPDKHSLAITEDKDTFEVKLTIVLV